VVGSPPAAGLAPVGGAGIGLAAAGGAGVAAGLGVAALAAPFLWRVTVSSRSAAATRCSVRGRDTSRARIAEVGVIFIPAMDPLSLH
jgi:hypothetical protein